MIASAATGLFFVLALYSFNKTSVPLNELWLPLITSMTACAALYVLLRAIFKSYLSTVLSLILIVSVFMYGYIPQVTVMGTVIFTSLIILSRTKLKITLNTKNASKIISTITSCMVLAAMVPILFNLNTESVKLEAGEVNQSYPDIYYIIPDSYDGEWTLSDAGFDNSRFLNFLKEKGFQVPEYHFANYARTYMSMASVLSMDYLTDTSYGYCYKYVEERIGPNAVVKYLKSKGYNYYRIGYKAWVPNDLYADVDLYYGKGLSFSHMLLKTLPFSKPYNYFARDSLRQDSVYAIDQLLNLPEFTQPTFVYCHILNPHNGSWGFPGFNADGSYPTDEQVKSESAKEMYYNEITYINKVLEQFIKEILSRPRKVVIIIQADEGYAIKEFDKNNYLPFYDDGLVDSHRIGGEAYNLSAILVPPEYSLTDPGSSNVNTFRLIFNSLFGEYYPILPDKFYFGHVIQNNDKEGWPMEDLYDATNLLPHLQGGR